MLKKQERDFKGIWIPKEIWLCKKLSLIEKIFFVEIDSLDNKDGCFASNNYFSEFFGKTPQRCSQIINSLIKKKYIKARYEFKGKEVIKRVLNIIDTYKINLKMVSRKNEDGIKKTLTRYKENVKDNNIINNTSNKLSNSNRHSGKFIIPSLQEIEDYILEKKYNVNAKVFLEYFTESKWHDSHGNKVNSWKGKIITWNSYNNNPDKKPKIKEYKGDITDFDKYSKDNPPEGEPSQELNWGK